MTSASPQSKPSPPNHSTHHHRKHPSLSRHDPSVPPSQTQKPPANSHPNPKLHPSVPRPPLRSNFDLEPNPFEQSFSSTAVSQSSTKAVSSDTQHADSEHSIHAQENPDPNHHRPLHDPTQSPDRPSGDDTKPVLPPLASIVSPAEPFSGWAMSNSLRAGPLSPAMLAGPANQTSLLGNFDSSFVRTGLTPDVSRTGFTPLIAGGGSFPPPTPNTAALFAIVNGTSAGQPLPNTATITPNTLNALNGVLNGTLGVGTAAGPLDSQANGQHIASQNYDMRHEANGRPNDAYGYQQDSYADNAAASALYLLSQQNAIRPQQQIAPSALTNQHDHQNHQNESNDNLDSDETTRRASNKRKSMDTSAAPATRGGKKVKAAPAAASTAPVRSSSRRRSTRAGPDDMDEDDDDDDFDQTYGGAFPAAIATTNGRQAATTAGGKASQKKPETEEEKRRNFLERNRQAALKCRQRKKKWLQDLQAKVEFLTTENERLTSALIASREEIARLSQLVVAHGGAPSNLATVPNDIQPQGGPNQHMSSQPVSINVSLPGVSKSLPAAVPIPSNVGHPSHSHQAPPPQGVTVGRGYGY